MNLIITGISLLGIWFAWKFIWQPTLLDTTRDKLFDLRDNSRAWFLKKGYTLENPTYRALRRLLNSYLLVADKVTISSFMVFMYVDYTRTMHDDKLEKAIKREFYTDNKDIEQYVLKIRWLAWNIIFGQMVFRNIFLALFFVLFAFCYTVLYFVRLAWHSHMPYQFFGFCRIAITRALNAFLAFTSYNTNSGGRLEKYSLTQPECATVTK